MEQLELFQSLLTSKNIEQFHLTFQLADLKDSSNVIRFDSVSERTCRAQHTKQCNINSILVSVFSTQWVRHI